jgi:hypothetical protein
MASVPLIFHRQSRIVIISYRSHLSPKAFEMNLSEFHITCLGRYVMWNIGHGKEETRRSIAAYVNSMWNKRDEFRHNAPECQISRFLKISSREANKWYREGPQKVHPGQIRTGGYPLVMERELIGAWISRFSGNNPCSIYEWDLEMYSLSLMPNELFVGFLSPNQLFQGPERWHVIWP